MNEQKRSNWIVYVLALMFMGPLLAAWVWFFFFQEIRNDNTVNFGDLVTPARQVSVAGLVAQNDLQATEYFVGKWSVLLTSRGDCGLDCENMLYQTRQVWIRLGKESHRVARVFANDTGELPIEITGLHPDLEYFLARDKFFEQFEQHGTLEVFVVDPRGFLVLRYKMPLDPAALYKDLIRLLKYSKIG